MGWRFRSRGKSAPLGRGEQQSVAPVRSDAINNLLRGFQPVSVHELVLRCNRAVAGGEVIRLPDLNRGLPPAVFPPPQEIRRPFRIRVNRSGRNSSIPLPVPPSFIQFDTESSW